MFEQIVKQKATGRLLLGAMLGIAAWVAVCVSCFVSLGSLPSTLKGPRTLQATPCSCAPRPALPEVQQVPNAEQPPRDVREPATVRVPCRT